MADGYLYIVGMRMREIRGWWCLYVSPQISSKTTHKAKYITSNLYYILSQSTLHQLVGVFYDATMFFTKKITKFRRTKNPIQHLSSIIPRDDQSSR